MIYVMVSTSETGEFHPFDAHQYVVDEASDIGRVLRKVEHQIRVASGRPDDAVAVTIHIDGPSPDQAAAGGYHAGYRDGFEAGRRAR